jgi:hypothetical protein
MPPQRKKAKTAAPPEADPAPLADPLATLHPDLAAASAPVKLDPKVLHPDLAAASTLPPQQSDGTQLHVDSILPQSSAPRPRQRKNAAANRAAVTASAAAAAAAAAAAHMHLHHQSQMFHEHADGQDGKPQLESEQGESAVSVDTAAEFLRTIQERESQKSILAMQGRQEPTGVVSADGVLPAEIATLYSIPHGQSQPPTYTGFPTQEQFDGMVDEYLGSLSPKKRAKALLTQQMYDDILQVLLNPTDTKTGSAQFRFWAKKMFKLVSTQVAHIVIHENKPVAVKEQLYDVLVQCHGQANHGGRDKTAGQAFPFFVFGLMVGSQVL